MTYNVFDGTLNPTLLYCGFVNIRVQTVLVCVCVCVRFPAIEDVLFQWIAYFRR